MELEWQKIEDHIYNKKVVNCDVYVLRITKKRNIYLMDKENFSYTFSCGANSEYSFSGSFYGTSITTLEDAKEYLLKFQKSYFRDDYKALRVLRESIRL